MKVLFVCSGNTCRSPMCEAYLKHLLRAPESPGVSVSSAGLSAGSGFAGCFMPASGHAIEVMASFGIDLSDHEARQLDSSMLADADLVVVMGKSHRDGILSAHPEYKKKVRLLMEYAGKPEQDVADPFGGTLRDYKECFLGMREGLERLFHEMTNQEKSKSKGI